MKKHTYLIVSLIILALFIIWTVLVKTVDVQYIYNNTYLGFHDLNYRFGDWATELGRFESMRKLSDIFLYISFGFTGILGVIAIIQLIKTKSFKELDKRFYILLGTYVLLVVIYFIFELAKINYAPDSGETLKASYPSTHVFIGGTLLLVNTYASVKMLQLKKNWIEIASYSALAVVIVLLIVTRALSVKHWITDIIGSIFLSASVYFMFVYANKRLVEQKEEENSTAIQVD